MTRVAPILAFLILAFVAVGCRTAYYSAMEKFGVDKRDILVDRVQEGREEQEDAQEQFRSTYDAFKAVTGFDGGDLEDAYDNLKNEYDDSVDSAGDVSKKIGDIDKVATDMFAEWKEETEEIGSTDLREESRTLLRDTERRYDTLITAMRRAEGKMAPVLSLFNDHVLFLKHNLNARAIASLESRLPEIETNVAILIEDMERSIAEADAFLSDMDS